MPKAREIRLEQNRKAARESRRRKKVMIEELQRSVIFFSRANGTLKQQNDELTRLLMQAQTQVTVSSTASNSTLSSDQPNDQSHQVNRKTENAEKTNSEQVQAQAVATQAVYESQGFPAAAARAAALTMSGNNLAPNTAPAPANTIQQALPAMQPGATMQAMANFQQAAAAAMQSAMGQMQSIPGVNMSQLAAAPVGANAQQAYTDTMTALAMQQAAAAAAASGQQFVMAGGVPFMHPMLAWQQQVQNQASPPVITQQQMAANSTPKQDN
uniref:BZIP domain-containing protein n=1 Tax=Phaeodactylum tricornutum TaxID=2850 RepID=A0A8J9SN82_PHATR